MVATLVPGDGEMSWPIVLGGVRRLPTLARLPGVCEPCDPFTAYWYFWCEVSDGGGSSNCGRCDALGLLEEKPGPPISDPECMWVG